MAGKEETPKCRKKTVTWTNEMIEDLIDFIEIAFLFHPIPFKFFDSSFFYGIHDQKT
jgi:hypothetical protein